MQMIEIEKLTPHPRNREFFDDIHGDKWEDFLESVKRNSVIEPIVATQDLMIVSGHQRVNASKQLGILAVPCSIRHYADFDDRLKVPKEDKILEELISTNLMQRGIGNVNPMKMARCIQELERIYGIKRGGDHGNQFTEAKPHNPNLPTQDKLAELMGISQDQLIRYKQLLDLIPDIQNLVDKGKLKPTVAHKILAKLPQDEQEDIINKLGGERLSKMTQKEVERHVEYYKQQNQELQQELQQEKSKTSQVQIVEKEVVVDKTDYESMNKLKTQLDKEKKDNEILEKKIVDLEVRRSNYEEKLRKIEENSKSEQQEMEQLKRKKEKLELQAHISISDLQIKIHNFINDASPGVFLQGAVASSGNVIKDDLLDSVFALEEFTRTLREMLDSKIESGRSNIIELN